jgi:hypothetical protein
LEAELALDAKGNGSFVFPADDYPHGPIMVRLSSDNGFARDNCYLQLYNKGGISWNEGIPKGPPPAARAGSSGAPTRWGRVGFRIQSHVDAGRIEARVDLTAAGIAAQTRLRLRARPGARIRSVRLNGRAWQQFDAASEVISVPPGTGGELSITAYY